MLRLKLKHISQRGQWCPLTLTYRDIGVCMPLPLLEELTWNGKISCQSSSHVLIIWINSLVPGKCARTTHQWKRVLRWGFNWHGAKQSCYSTECEQFICQCVETASPIRYMATTGKTRSWTHCHPCLYRPIINLPTKLQLNFCKCTEIASSGTRIERSTIKKLTTSEYHIFPTKLELNLTSSLFINTRKLLYQ